MDAGKRARIARLAGFICVGLALLNVTIAVSGMVADKTTRGYRGNLAIAASLGVIGIVNLRRAGRLDRQDNRSTPPDA